MRWIIILTIIFSVFLFLSCDNEHDLVIAVWIDSYVDEDTPSENYGYEEDLIVGLGEYPRWKHIYLQFDLEEIPSDAEIIEADLYLFCKDVYNNNQFDFYLYRSRQGWAENLITWYNQPNNSIVHFTFPYGHKKVGEAARWYIWDVTDLVADWVSGESMNTGVVIVDDQEISTSTTNTSFKIFSSKEGAHPPELRVKYR